MGLSDHPPKSTVQCSLHHLPRHSHHTPSLTGAYYTVNPIAINKNVNVLAENKRVVTTIYSKQFGTVAYVTIGATLVGSIILTTEEGQIVRKYVPPPQIFTFVCCVCVTCD